MKSIEHFHVFVVDDEPDICHLLERLLRSAGYCSKSFHSAEDFLESYSDSGPACLLLDVRLDGMSGLDLQSKLRLRGVYLPIIMISGDVSVSDSVRAMKEGAISVLEKPFDDCQLLELVESAVQRSRIEWPAAHEWKTGMQGLSKRERQVAELMLHGKSTKEIAKTLHISPSTVDKHRLQVFTKLRVDSPATLLFKASRTPHYGRLHFEGHQREQ